MRKLAALGAILLAFAGPLVGPGRAQDAADLVLRLDRLENENRRQNGQIEELRFQVRRLEDQLKRFQTDADTPLPGSRNRAPRERGQTAGNPGSGKPGQSANHDAATPFRCV